MLANLLNPAGKHLSDRIGDKAGFKDEAALRELHAAAKKLTFSAYPAHGSGFIRRVDGEVDRLMRAVTALAKPDAPAADGAAPSEADKILARVVREGGDG